MHAVRGTNEQIAQTDGRKNYIFLSELKTSHVMTAFTV